MAKTDKAIIQVTLQILTTHNKTNRWVEPNLEEEVPEEMHLFKIWDRESTATSESCWEA